MSFPAPLVELKRVFAGTTATSPHITLGPLADGVIDLVEPDERWIDAILRETGSRLTRTGDPRLASTTRRTLHEFLRFAPAGRVPGDAKNLIAPAQHYWLRYRDPVTNRLRMAGGIGVRFGNTDDLRQFTGHLGYHVYPPARGQHFAERACRLVVPLLRSRGVDPIWITCNPENLASRRTCERLGATFIETVDLPPTHPFYLRGERQKRRYLLGSDQ